MKRYTAYSKMFFSAIFFSCIAALFSFNYPGSPEPPVISYAGSDDSSFYYNVEAHELAAGYSYSLSVRDKKSGDLLYHLENDQRINLQRLGIPKQNTGLQWEIKLVSNTAHRTIKTFSQKTDVSIN